MKKTLLCLALAITSLLSFAKEPAEISIIPRPQSIEMLKGTFKASGAVVNCDPNFDAQSKRAVSLFSNQLTLISGKTSSYASAPGMDKAVANGTMRGFAFMKNSDLAPEEYSIEVGSKSVIVNASDFHGVLYAIETLKQLLPAEFYGKTPSNINLTIPCVSIKDKPRFSYRGMHLDVARHFFGMDEVKKYLDIMASFKMNRLHWHLTDDQGWRIEIKKYPLLTEIGSIRTGTMIARDFKSDDGIPYGGFFTQAEVKEIINYADNLGITIIPEIDLPGHMLAALAAYPQYGCTGGPYEVWHRWGISDQVLCPGKEITFQFLEDVLGEIADLFPAEYVHIGGDECPKTEWEKCPECQALIAKLGIKATKEISAEQFLQNYVTSRMQQFLATKGKKIIGWDEILEGELAEGATVMSWRGVKGGVKASSMGYDVIMTPNTYFYFDYCQVKDKEKAPVSIGGYLPLEKVYSYEPSEGIEASAFHHILGCQANLWTEYITSNEHLEYMLLPRMFALSEIQWCKPEDKDYDRFKNDVITHEFKVLDILGYKYCKDIIGIPGLE